MDITRRKAISVFAAAAVMPFVGCAKTSETETAAQAAKETNMKPTDKYAPGEAIVVVYSRTGNNYAVGNIKVGNTMKVAKTIAAEVGAEVYEVKEATPYAADYDECTRQAKNELRENARPALSMMPPAEAVAKAKVVYIGYPVWWGEAPMPIYTWLDSVDLSGKTVYPFCTHEGSGMSGEAMLKKAEPNATFGKGLAMRGVTAQKNDEERTKRVREWLNQK